MLPPEAGRHVIWVDEGLGFVDGGPEGASSLVIDDGDVVVVDAGLPEAAARDLAPHAAVLLVTHLDPRHLRHASHFERVWAPRPDGRGLLTLDGLFDALAVARGDREGLRSRITPGFEPPKVERHLRPGGVLLLPRTEWQVLGAPGTAPGTCALYEPRRRVLFAGALGPGPGTPTYGWPTADLDDLEASLARLGELDVELLLGSHGPPRRRGAKQAFREAAAAIRQRDAFYYEALESPRSVADLVELGRILGERARKDPLARYAERVMVEKHLSRLLARSLAVARQDGRYSQA